MAVVSSRLDTAFHQQNLRSVYTGTVQGGQAVAIVRRCLAFRTRRRAVASVVGIARRLFICRWKNLPEIVLVAGERARRRVGIGARHVTLEVASLAKLPSFLRAGFA